MKKKKTNSLAIAIIIASVMLIAVFVLFSFQESWLLKLSNLNLNLGQGAKVAGLQKSAPKNPIITQVDNLIKQISRTARIINLSTTITRTEKNSYFGELNVLLSRANEAKQKATSILGDKKQTKGAVNSLKPELKKISSLLRSIRERIGLAPVPYTANMTQEQKCPDNYGLRADTVLMYYTDEPHSNVMLPLVSALEAEGYSFYKTNDLWNKRQEACFDLIGVTPTFVCAGTKEKLIGEVSKEELKAFADRCKS